MDFGRHRFGPFVPIPFFKKEVNKCCDFCSPAGSWDINIVQSAGRRKEKSCSAPLRKGKVQLYFSESSNILSGQPPAHSHENQISAKLSAYKLQWAQGLDTWWNRPGRKKLSVKTSSVPEQFHAPASIQNNKSYNYENHLGHTSPYSVLREHLRNKLIKKSLILSLRH